MTPRIRRILRQHLRTDALLGLEQVPRSVGAAMPAEATSEPAPEPTSEAPSEPTDAGSGAGWSGEARRGATPSPAAPAEGAGATPLPDSSSDTPASRDAPPMNTKQKQAALDAMKEQEVRGCTKCPLHQSRTQTVFGEGSPDASIMFIGEGPGQSEDEQGRPFVGRAGGLLNDMIRAMGYQREEVYITNIVKSRPPNNRAPTAAEVAACWPYLRRQIEIIRPKAIVTLGGPASKTLLESKEGITRLRGLWHEYIEVEPPIPVMPTFHPAFVLRSYTRENRAKVWSDLQAVRDYVAEVSSQ